MLLRVSNTILTSLKEDFKKEDIKADVDLCP